MKIKIVSLVIDGKTFNDGIMAGDKYVQSVLSRCAEWGVRGDNIWTDPIVAWSNEYNDIVHALNSRGYKHEFTDITDDYEFYRTAAPAEYDYTGFGTIHLCSFPPDTYRGGSPRIERLVAIPKERVEYQTARYGSGMYSQRKVG